MKKVVILIENLYEEMEFHYPRFRLLEERHHVSIAGTAAKETYKGKYGYPQKSDLSFKELKTSNFDAVIVPGGFAPDYIRRSPEAIEFVSKMHQENKCVAMICHALWVGCSAKILKDKKVTSYYSVKDDVVNAGGRWVDQSVVIDENLISSRMVSDLPDFTSAIVGWLRR